MSAVSETPHGSSRPPILVSACLLGLHTRYDGGACESACVLRLAGERCLMPICPEQLGGLPTPRPASEIEAGDGCAVLEGGARVMTAGSRDVTAHFLAGAEAAAEIVRLLAVREAWLKYGSPSCGVTCIRRNGRDVPGKGVTAALLERKGLRVRGCE
jgi:uncharacterized protein YbbK (DUF523 family)